VLLTRDCERRLLIARAKLATLCGISALLLVVATAAGAAPFLVKDINPGKGRRCSVGKGSDPYGGVNVGDILFFFGACGATDDCQLWKSDGTPANTVQVSHIVTKNLCDLGPKQLTVVDGRVFFVAGGSFFDGYESGYDTQLWVSDGTNEGTVRVTEPDVLRNFDDMLSMGGHLFFTAWDDISRELWRSDGTPSGTVRLTNFRRWENPENFDSNSWDLTSVDGTLFFSRCQKATGCELWKSDGTAASTVRVAVITPPGSYDKYPLSEDYDWGLVQFTPLHDRLFFVACEDAFRRLGYCELWQSDGSEAGTVRVMPFFPGIPPDDLYEHEGPYPGLAAANGRVFFQSCQPHASGDWSCGLWKSDGTPGGTVQVLDFGPMEFGTLTTVGGTLFFWSGGNIWRSDGTAAGTVSLGVQGSRWTDVRGTLFFDRYDPVTRAERDTPPQHLRSRARRGAVRAAGVRRRARALRSRDRRVREPTLDLRRGPQHGGRL
jgi:ELWxxDGT repeat protein